MKPKVGRYYQLTDSKYPENDVIVYYYLHPNLGVEGFAFNLADGGGFVSLSDLSKSSKIRNVNIDLGGFI